MFMVIMVSKLLLPLVLRARHQNLPLTRQVQKPPTPSKWLILQPRCQSSSKPLFREWCHLERPAATKTSGPTATNRAPQGSPLRSAHRYRACCPQRWAWEELPQLDLSTTMTCRWTLRHSAWIRRFSQLQASALEEATMKWEAMEGNQIWKGWTQLRPRSSPIKTKDWWNSD